MRQHHVLASACNVYKYSIVTKACQRQWSVSSFSVYTTVLPWTDGDCDIVIEIGQCLIGQGHT